jgi:NAD(P)-dependent dehydrogenase (short-subunit alcohol dehydrogenase family)
VRRLAAAGAKVATTARSELPQGRRPDLFVPADLSTVAGVSEVVRVVLERFGGLDILVHNVGGSTAPGGGFAALTDETWQRELDLNLLAAVRLHRAILPSMLKQGSGSIVHVTSTQRRLPLYEATLGYAAAKALSCTVLRPTLSAREIARRLMPCLASRTTSWTTFSSADIGGSRRAQARVEGARQGA